MPRLLCVQGDHRVAVGLCLAARNAAPVWLADVPDERAGMPRQMTRRRIAIERLPAGPVVLRLTGHHVHHLELSLARTVDDVRILRMRHDRTSLASRPRAPFFAALRVRLARDNNGRVVLLRAVKFVGKLVVKPDAINLGRRLIQLS